MFVSKKQEFVETHQFLLPRMQIPFEICYHTTRPAEVQPDPYLWLYDLEFAIGYRADGKTKTTYDGIEELFEENA